MVLHFLDVFIRMRRADTRHHHLCFANKDIFLRNNHLVDFGEVFDIASGILLRFMCLLRLCLCLLRLCLCLLRLCLCLLRLCLLRLCLCLLRLCFMYFVMR